MLARCMKRAETSGRVDDNPDVIKKRVQNYFDQSYPVVEYYTKFGKVRRIDATGDVNDVYAATKKAVIPQTMFLIGPKACGKTTIAKNMAERTNMKHLDFLQWRKDNGLKDAGDEEVCAKLVDCLAHEIKPRVVLESFPQNEFQAKFFLRNCKEPANVFGLTCSIDISQERMQQLGESSAGYVSSAVLSQKIREYTESSKNLIPYLKANTNFAEISTEGAFDKTMDLVNSKFEPCVIHIRPGASSNDLRKEITEKLSEQHGFINLDVNALIRDENERKTEIGQEMHAMVQSNRIIPAEMMVRMLKKIIYSGRTDQTKFILTSFPDIIEQAKEFETNCSRISAIIYSTTDDPVVEIKNNNLSLFNIDSLFQKEFRLKTMCAWDYSVFEEKLGNKVEYGVVVGQPNSGKTTLAAALKAQLDYSVIDMKAIADKIRAGMTNEEGEAADAEAEVPIAEVEKAIRKMLEEGHQSGKRMKYIFDGFTHADAAAFTAFAKPLGVPAFLLHLTTSKQHLKERHCKKNEIDEYPADAEEALDQQAAAASQVKDALSADLCAGGRTDIMDFSTDASFETTSKALVQKFSPQVILLNHEKRLGVDTTCANLAIKFNMIYISVYQIIQQHIKNNTDWGKLLKATKRTKSINLTTQVRDEFNEAEYSPSLFDQKLVMELIRSTITEKRTSQRFVILEGLCNSHKLQNDEEKLELRNMDELWQIEKHIGEIKAIIGLQFAFEPDTIDQKELEFEQFDEAEKQKPEPVPADDGGDGEPKAKPFRPADYSWTKTNRKPFNLPQLFLACKGEAKTTNEVRTAE
jgi:adenylate kinase family enzyme